MKKIISIILLVVGTCYALDVQPPNLSTTVTQHSVYVSWTSSVIGTYSVYRDPGTGYVRRVSGLKVLNWTDTKVKSGQKFTYAVTVSVYMNGKLTESDFSNSYTVVIP